MSHIFAYVLFTYVIYLQELVRSMLVKTNDVHLVIYLRYYKVLYQHVHYNSCDQSCWPFTSAIIVCVPTGSFIVAVDCWQRSAVAHLLSRLCRHYPPM
jgi:hypothetical protein